MLSFNLAPSAPFMTYEQYSRTTGISVNTLKTMVADGRLILMRKESPSQAALVNVIAMTELAARQAHELLG